MKKPVSRIASIMLGALTFTPVYTLPAMASDGVAVGGYSWVAFGAANGACYNVYNNSGTSVYIANNNGNESNSFAGSPGVISVYGCAPPPPPCCSGGGDGYGGGGG